jgi:hypothetical protein
VISSVTFQVTEETMSTAIEIPLRGKRCFKEIPLDAWFYEDFIKRYCLGGKVEIDNRVDICRNLFRNYSE